MSRFLLTIPSHKYVMPPVCVPTNAHLYSKSFVVLQGEIQLKGTRMNIRRSLYRFLRNTCLATVAILTTSPAWASPGAVDTTFNVVPNNAVYSILTQPNGKILLGGAFTQVGSTQRGELVRLFPDGTVDTSFTNVINQGGTIMAMLMQPDGKLLVAGNFSTVSFPGPVRQSVARLNPDGSVDISFTNSSPTGTVNALGLQTDGKVLIGGQFTQVGGVAHQYIARLNGDGTVDASFNPGNISGSMVNAIAVQADGNILIGGSFGQFTTYGLSKNNIARLLTNGAPDATYQGSASGTVQAIYLQPDGRTMWGGVFTSLGSSLRPHIGRLNTDGTVDLSFNATFGANNTVYDIAEDADGNIYLGGTFSAYSNFPRPGVARAYSNGNLDTTFTNTIKIGSPQFRALAIQADGKVLAGGIFTETDTAALRTNLVRLYGDNYPAEILTQPKGQNVGIGADVTFTVELSNPTAIYYQWYKDGEEIPGANFSEYSVFGTQFEDSGKYSVFVTTGFGGTMSSNAVLQVGARPAITQQPTNVTVLAGQTASFSVTASGQPLNYYWKFGQTLSGTNATLLLTNVNVNQGGNYFVTVSNFLGSTNSTQVTLTVLASITNVIISPDLNVAVGGTATFSVTATGSPKNYQWLKGGNPISGANNASYSITNVQPGDASAYSVIVSNQFNAITSAAAALAVGFPPVVTTQPISVTNNLGDTVSFNSAFSGDQPLTYLWLFNGNPLTNQIGTNLTLTNVQIANIGSYALTAVNPFGSATTSNALLNLNGFPSNLYSGLVAYYPFNGNANDAAGTNNGTVLGATLASDRFGATNAAYYFDGISNSIQLQSSPAVFGNQDFTISLWFNPLTLPNPAIPSNAAEFLISKGQNNFELSTGGSNSPTAMTFLPRQGSGNPYTTAPATYQTNTWQQVVAVYQASTTNVAIFLNGAAVALTGPGGIPNSSDVAIPATLGLRSDGTLGFNGFIDDVRIYNHALSSNDVQQLYALESGQPAIVQQPHSLALIAGSTANFSVQAVGGGPLSYQWYYSNAPVANATNPTLTVPNVQPGDAGAYYAVVSNSLGVTPSSMATLSIGQTPQTLQLLIGSNQSVTIQMPGTAGFNYVLQATTNLTPPIVWQTVGSVATGSNGVWTFTDTNAPSAGVKYYRVSSP